MADRRAWVARMADRNDWLAQVQEEVVDPEREIVDPHHHLWERDGTNYLLDQLWSDTGTGHRVVQTVYIECREKYRDEQTPEHLRPVGETAYVAGVADASAKNQERATIAGIVAHADLRHDQLDAVLDAHEQAGRGYFRGIRHAGACEPHPEGLAMPGHGPAGLYADKAFRRGLALLGQRGLTYDTWHYHHQNGAFAELARAVPETTLILDHFGTPLGVGRHADKRDEIFADWKNDIAAISECPNTVAKLGGMAMPDNGFGWHERDRPVTSDEFVEAQAPYYHHTIACFGPDRCMFESNFPVDRVSISYAVLWNAFKKIAADYDEAALTAMFTGTARRVYSL